MRDARTSAPRNEYRATARTRPCTRPFERDCSARLSLELLDVRGDDVEELVLLTTWEL